MERLLLRTAALVLVSLVPSACGRNEVAPAERPPNVVLVTVDALRADHVGWADPRGSVTPGLDALAADSVVFTQAVSAAQWTPPSMASLMTGRFPTFEGVERWEDGVRYGFSDLASPEERARRGLTRNVITLAELLSDHGWTTAGFQSNPWLSRANGFDQGFGHYEQFHRHLQHVRSESSHTLQGRYAPAGVVADTVTRWIMERPDRPFFLWVHLMDPHSPYLPPEVCRERVPDHDLGDLELNEALYHRLYTARDAPGAAADYRSAEALGLSYGDLLGRARELYRAEVRCSDRGIARIVDALRVAGELDRSLVVVTADHGEAFGEHGDIFHERRQPAPEELIRVPLLVRPPGGLADAPRIGDLVQLVDVAPTVADFAGIRHPDLPFEGLSMRPLLDTGPSPPRTAYFSLIEAGVVRDATWKYRFDRRTRTEHLFRIAGDPLETKDVASEHPAVVSRMRDAWTVFAAKLHHRRKHPPGPSEAEP